MASSRSLSFLVVPFVFFCGIQVGFWLSSVQNSNRVLDDTPHLDRKVQQRLQAILDQESSEFNENCRQQQVREAKGTAKKSHAKINKGQSSRFGPNMSYFAHGASRTCKDEFLDELDYGIRRKPPSSEEALLLYNHRDSLPTVQKEDAMYANGEGIPKLSLRDATENCTIVQVVSTWSRDEHQCLAVVGQYESFTRQRWERANLTTSFQAVQSGYPYAAPAKWTIEVARTFVREYLTELDDALNSLKPLVQKVAKNNAVIAMVSNMGQADLLLNFVCSARARKLDISSLIVFATDQQARAIATELGLTVYYNDKLFLNLPRNAAVGFGDFTFAEMMKAKMASVHLVNALGYDVLFQDLDVVWSKSPLDFFVAEYKDFDILVQDEGSDWRNMAPHSANTGFYFVRHNHRTRYMLQHMLYSSDWVRYERSHQKVLNTILPVHAAVFGLRVKTLSENDFPCGAQYHLKKSFMRSIVKGELTPWIFHMSWTTNRNDKLLFMKQMGLWYVHQPCEGDGAFNNVLQGRNMSSSYQQTCCSVEPLVSCHYKDKPSIIPCPDSPAVAKRGISFWA